MYRTGEFRNVTTIHDYMKDYIDIECFLEYCKRCDKYGKLWSCPPFDFNPAEYWNKYKYLHVIGTKIIFEQDTINQVTDKKAMEDYINQVLTKEKDILSDRMLDLEKKYPGSVGLSAGNCNICKMCAKPKGLTCVNPDKMRYSIECLGGNVVKTVSELLGIELKWPKDKLPEYLTLVNGFLADNEIIEF